MISRQSHTQEWIMSVRRTSPRMDPILIEKMIMALTLVEMLRVCGLDFILKGGTSLALVLEKLRRFSIDIDIVLSTSQELDGCFQAVIQKGVFIRCEEDTRAGDLPKKHFKFFFNSIIQEKEGYVLLDILFEENLYAGLHEVGIQSPLLSLDGNCTTILCPLSECLLGDKLTAFAPHTTGIQFGRNKELEIAKQLFDVATLFDVSENIGLVSATHRVIAAKELLYRGLNDLTPRDVLADTFNTSCWIGQRGYLGDTSEYSEVEAGISKLRGFIYSGTFTPDSVIICAAKAAVLTALILNGENTIVRFDRRTDLSARNIRNPVYNKLNKLKKTNLEAFYYFYQALEINGYLEK